MQQKGASGIYAGEADGARRAKEAVRNQRTHAREARKRANPDARVYMAPAVRRAVVEALGLQKSKDDEGSNSSNDLQKLAELEGVVKAATSYAM